MKNCIIRIGLSLCILVFPFACLAETLTKQLADLSAKVGMTSDKEEKTNLLLRIGDLFQELNDWNGRDSMYSIAANFAQQQGNDSMEMRVYRAYFDADNAAATATAKIFAGRLLSLAHTSNKNEDLFEAYYAAAKLCLYSVDYPTAVMNANSAFHSIDLVDDDRVKIRGYLLLGDCTSLNNNKLEAFRHYSNALYLAHKNDDSGTIFRCYGHLSSFYSSIGNVDMALVFKNKQLQGLRVTQNDSFALMDLYSELAMIFYDKGDKISGEGYTDQVLAYAERHNAIRLKNTAFSIYRAYLVNNNLLSALYDLYTRRYPHELDIIAETDRVLFYRLNAYLQEVKGNVDSARIYYDMAAEKLSGYKDNAVLCNFYKRYGQFLLRFGDLGSARSKFEIAYGYAEAANYYPFLVETTNYLDSLSFVQKDYQNAYKYSRLNKSYAAQLALTVKQDELLRLEINSEKQQRELAIEKEQQQKKHRHSIQYLAIIIIIASVFVVLAMIGSFRVPKFLIKATGFFSFLMLFEFIVMVTDFQIEHLTHGEPYKILMIKICIIAMLTPLHHWLEHKVLEYLYQHKLIDTNKLRVVYLIQRIWKRPKTGVTDN